MAYDGVHLRLHELAGSGDRLLGVAVIVDWEERDLLAENPAGRVQLGDLNADAFLHLLAEPGQPAGQRTRHADQDLGMDERGGAERHCDRNYQMCEKSLHGVVSPGRQPRESTYHGSSERRQGRRSAEVSPAGWI